MEYAARLMNIRKHYQLGTVEVQALRGVTLDVPKGDFLAIMGSSGSGKSTMLNLLGALDRPTSGKYILGERDVSEMSDDDLSEARNSLIGFIFQSFNLIQQYTVMENIQVPLLYRSGAAAITRKDLQKCAELGERVGLGTRMDHRPFQLSGGQQQRVAIARALVNDPAIILADEPTGNLDSATGVEIMRILDELHEEGRTIIMVTHEPEIAEHANRKIYMRDGLIAGEGIFPGHQLAKA